MAGECVIGLRLAGAALGERSAFRRARVAAPGQWLTVVRVAERRQRIAEPGKGVAAMRAWCDALRGRVVFRHGRLAASG